MDELKFDQFWQSSELDKYSLPDFARRMEAFSYDEAERRLDYPEAPRSLSKTRLSRLDKVSRQRKSQRKFGEQGLGERQLALILSSLRAWSGEDSRAYPSAGATYAIETFVVCWRVRGLENAMFYYDPVDHGLVKLSGRAPSWSQAKDNINVQTEGRPAMMIVLAAKPSRTIGKYGERGGRFVLLEAGAAMQQIGLALAEQQLPGVIAGGLLDGYWRKTLGLSKQDTKVVIGYLIGSRPKK